MRDILKKISDALNISGRDAKIFIVSLLLAYSIWLIHNLSLNYSETVRIPVQARCDINGHSDKSANTTVVTARCRTRGFSLIKLERAERNAPIVVRFTTSDMHQKGDEFFYVTADDLNRYAGQIFGGATKLESFVSDTLMFRFPFENHKRVPVQPVYSMNFRPQYTNSSEFRISPDSVTVYGEPVHLSGIDRVFTESLNLYDIDSQVHGELRLEKIKGVRLSDESVRYSMEVSRFIEIKADVPVTARNVPKGKMLIIYPSSAEVTFRCSFPVSVNPAEGAHLVIDYGDFASSLRGQCIPTLEPMPAGLLEYRVEPQVFDCVESGR